MDMKAADSAPPEENAESSVGRGCPVLPGAPTGHQLGEDSFRRVVEWAPSAMVMIDREGIMVMVNTQTEIMFDYGRQALIGQSVEMLVPERFRANHRHFRGGFFDDPQPRPMGVGRDLFGFLKDQGAWYTPFIHPNSTGRYDIRGLHAEAARKD